MKVLGLLFLVIVVVGCATLSEEERGFVREFDENTKGDDFDADEIEDFHSAWFLAGYVALSEKERASMQDSQAVADIKSFLGSDPADDFKSYRDCLTAGDINYIRRGGLGFDPKRLNEAVVEADPNHLTARQKVILTRIVNEMFRGFFFWSP